KKNLDVMLLSRNPKLKTVEGENLVVACIRKNSNSARLFRFFRFFHSFCFFHSSHYLHIHQSSCSLFRNTVPPTLLNKDPLIKSL
ncbi:hypothetical protein EMCG_01845, partial [[Emmonsia] crescens]